MFGRVITQPNQSNVLLCEPHTVFFSTFSLLNTLKSIGFEVCAANCDWWTQHRFNDLGTTFTDYYQADELYDLPGIYLVVKKVDKEIGINEF